MPEDIHVTEFSLPDGFLSAFESAQGGDARMKVVDQFFEREEVTLDKDGTLELKPNEPHQVYLVGSSSLIHIERQEPEGTLWVAQPVHRKRGTIGKNALEDKVVSQLKKGRKLWLLIRKVAVRPRGDKPPRESARESDRAAQTSDSLVSAAEIHPDDIVPDISSHRLAAVEDEGKGKEVDPQPFSQLRTMLQNVRLLFWNGDARSQPTEPISVAAQKAEEHDISGAIQTLEALENVFVRLIEQWEHDLQEAQRKVKRGGGEAGGPNKIKMLNSHHSEMKSRIAQAKTKFRIMLNWLRELESEQKRAKQG